jgi:hypothetical protein
MILIHSLRLQHHKARSYLGLYIHNSGLLQEQSPRHLANRESLLHNAKLVYDLFIYQHEELAVLTSYPAHVLEEPN